MVSAAPRVPTCTMRAPCEDGGQVGGRVVYREPLESDSTRQQRTSCSRRSFENWSLAMEIVARWTNPDRCTASS